MTIGRSRVEVLDRRQRLIANVISDQKVTGGLRVGMRLLDSR